MRAPRSATARPRMQRGRAVRGLTLAAPPVAVILLFVGLPTIAAIMYTVGYTGGLNSVIASIAQHQHSSGGIVPTFDAYVDVFTDSSFLASLASTVIVTVVSTFVVVAMAWFLALYLRFVGGPIARAVSGLSVVPMFIPAVIGAYAILAFYAPNGLPRTLAALLGWSEAPSLSYTIAGVIVGSVWSNLPFAVLMIVSALAAVPTGLIDAARDAGAGPIRRFWDVLLPMSSVPTVIATTFTAIGILGSFTLPYVVGPTGGNLLGPVMSNTYSAFNQPQQAQVMAVVVFALATIAAIPYIRANFRRPAAAPTVPDARGRVGTTA
jgi:ABC-type spermidine/putrescine transport system permease subunit I